MEELRFRVFDFADYREFLRALVGPQTQRKGMKSKISNALGIQKLAA